MKFEDIHDRNQDFVGAKGLIYFGDSAVLSYVRDTNTNSFPQYIDLSGGGREVQAEVGPETPFETFQRETHEEFSLIVQPEHITYAKCHPSMLDASRIGYFLVARLPETEIEHIEFGNEGESWSVTPLPELLANERLIPILRNRIEDYLQETGEFPVLEAPEAL